MATGKKLTLYVDENLIQRVKEYAQQEGVSVSELVGNYFTEITTKNTRVSAVISPEIQALVGAASPDVPPDGRTYAREQRARRNVSVTDPDPKGV
ncbi:MAG: Ribbon-helix-helix protein, copG family [Bacteroidetes bacterium HLUCCA01]|nr:MAG: Ribbon-helix-helix protein, copG family [Bacteroidetes bacterium HLUCCA01]